MRPRSRNGSSLITVLPQKLFVMFLQRPKKASMTFYLRPRYYSFVRKQGTTAELRLKTHLSLLYVKYSVILCPRNNMHVSLRVLTVAWSWRIRHDNATRDKHWTGISRIEISANAAH